jgi:glycosyltransferase involved in cell wall biosynthesis
LKIAFIGQKGIPATFGGVEYHVEELALRLTARGHDVTAYVRDWYTPREQLEFCGVKLKHAPTIKTKHLDAFVHSFACSIDALLNQYDIIHYQAIGPSFFSWMPKLKGNGIVVTIHSYDYKAGKWGGCARYFLKKCETMALKIPHHTIVVAKHQRDFYRSLGNDVIYIPNGVPLPESSEPHEITSKFGLKGRDYILSMGRLVPEKRIDWLLDSFLKIKPDSIKLVIAGGSSATDDYVAALHRRAKGDADVIFAGYVAGRLKAELFSNARLFVIPSELEGLPIALLEAMSYSLPCLASDIPPHLEVITDSVNGFLFNKDNQNDLTQNIQSLLTLDDQKLFAIGEEARLLVAGSYNWDDVVDQVEDIYYGLLNGTSFKLAA